MHSERNKKFQINLNKLKYTSDCDEIFNYSKKFIPTYEGRRNKIIKPLIFTEKNSQTKCTSNLTSFSKNNTNANAVYYRSAKNSPNKLINQIKSIQIDLTPEHIEIKKKNSKLSSNRQRQNSSKINRLSVSSKLNTERIKNVEDYESDLELKDQIVLEDKKSFEYKENIRYILKEELSNAFKMDDFFLIKENRVNFLQDSYQVPYIKNKLFRNSVTQSNSKTIKYEKLEGLKCANSIDKKISICLNSWKRRFQTEKDNLRKEYEIFLESSLEPGVSNQEQIKSPDFTYKNNSSKDCHTSHAFVDYFQSKYEIYKSVDFTNEKIKGYILNENKERKMIFGKSNKVCANHFYELIDNHLNGFHKMKIKGACNKDKLKEISEWMKNTLSTVK